MESFRKDFFKIIIFHVRNTIAVRLSISPSMITIYSLNPKMQDRKPPSRIDGLDFIRLIRKCKYNYTIITFIVFAYFRSAHKK